MFVILTLAGYVRAGLVPVTDRSGAGGWTAVLLERR